MSRTLPVALARDSILKLRPYRSARSLINQGRIFLDANESPEGELNRYPQPQPREILTRFADLYEVAPERIIVGRGSDEAIDLLTRAFCEPVRDEIVIFTPTYGMYEVAADIQNCGVATIPLQFDGSNWDLDFNALDSHLSQSRNKTKLIYICNPNNPTGTLFSEGSIRQIAERTQGQSLLVIDEAYAEFNSGRGLLPLLDQHPHVVILRTLSKAWALAGLRCGVALASPEIVELLQKVRAPYPLPEPVIQQVQIALSEAGRRAMQSRVRAIVDERERLALALREIPLVQQVFASSANFLLVQFKDEPLVMQACLERGLVLRSRAQEIGSCIRITVGTKPENDELLRILAELAAMT